MGAQRETGLQLAWRAAVLANLSGSDAKQVRSLLERARRKGIPFTNFHDETVFGRMREHPDVRTFFEPSSVATR
jgi:hypothetical protein